MDLTWRDTATTGLAVLGGLTVFAKLMSYSWWLVGSWKGAIATLGVIGLAMLLINASDLTNWKSLATWMMGALWLGAAVLVIVGLFVASQPLFYSAAIVLAVAWVAELAMHSWHTSHHTRTHYVGAS